MYIKNHGLKAMALAILGISVSFVLMRPSYFGVCSGEYKYCFSPFDELIGQPLWVFSWAMAIVSFALLFVKKSVYNVWKKFALVYVFIYMAIISITPVTASFLNPNKKLVSLWLAGIFFIISIIIILAKRERHGVLEEEEC